jgi:POT family proton-dependent oligopeptide transporter
VSEVLAAAPGSSLAAHPAGLKVVFFAEMWERFSYYGMRALLVLYLVNGLHYARADALELYGIYTGLVWVTPLVGGYLADRWLGLRPAAVIGAILMVLGHFAMAVPQLLTTALTLLIVGNGFFKPNTSSLVGRLYGDDDPRRDGGYTIFYMGINLGAFLAPLVAGTLGEKLGWHWGFASAGVGMAIGLLTLLRWQHLLGDAGLPAGQQALDARDWRRVAVVSVTAAVGVVMGVAAWPMLASAFRAVPTFVLLALGAILVVFALRLPGRGNAGSGAVLRRDDWGRLLALAVVTLFVIFFWMGFEQAGGTMNLFADQQTDRHLLGWEIPASWFQSLNPLLIIFLAPPLAALWLRLDRSRRPLSDTAKQGLGMIVLGSGFVVLAYAQSLAATGPVGPQWLAIVYALHTIGELMLSPVGLAMVSRVAPLRVAALMMGLWFCAIGIASYLAGTLEARLAGSGIPLYWFLVGASMLPGALLMLISPWLQRLMHAAAAK